MFDEKECCGNCRYHRADKSVYGAWHCTNDQSEYYSDWTEYEDCCDEWEGRQ